MLLGKTNCDANFRDLPKVPNVKFILQHEVAFIAFVIRLTAPGFIAVAPAGKFCCGAKTTVCLELTQFRICDTYEESKE